MERQKIDYYAGIFEPYKCDMNMEHWIDVFPETRWKIPFAELMWGLGFEMDCYHSFLDANPQFSSSNLSDHETRRNVMEVLEKSDSYIVGCFLFSFFRSKTHWDYSSALTAEEEAIVLRLFELLESKLNEREQSGGGRKMSTAQQRIEVFEDTMAWIKSDTGLSASIPVAKRNTEIFYEDDYPSFDSSKLNDTLITVTKARSYEAAMRLHAENPESKIAVMNFANAFHAGGGVTKGSSAQEECLCRTSTLYPLLYRRTLRDTFYKHHHDLGTPKATDSLIYTEGVIICKTDEDLPQRLPKEKWVTVDVITIAAPDLRTSSNQHAPLVGNGTFMNNAELFGYHVKRAIHMLTVAAYKGADTLVLGAFGCGAFRNDPEVVARAYRTALQEFPKVFKKIEFAVYCSPQDDSNYKAFSRIITDTNI